MEKATLHQLEDYKSSKNNELTSDEMQSWSSCKSPLWPVSGFFFGAGYSSVFSLNTSTIIFVAAWSFLMNQENYVIYLFLFFSFNSLKIVNQIIAMASIVYYICCIIYPEWYSTSKSRPLLPHSFQIFSPCILEMESVIQI